MPMYFCPRPFHIICNIKIGNINRIIGGGTKICSPILNAATTASSDPVAATGGILRDGGKSRGFSGESPKSWLFYQSWLFADADMRDSMSGFLV